MISLKSAFTYDGNWDDAYENGLGTIIYKNGDTYTGSFEDTLSFTVRVSTPGRMVRLTMVTLFMEK